MTESADAGATTTVLLRELTEFMHAYARAEAHALAQAQAQAEGRASSHADDYGVGSLAADLVSRMVSLLGVTGAGVSVARAGRVEFVAAWGAEATELERFQERQSGPCVDAIRRGEVMAVADLGQMPETVDEVEHARERWRVFAKRAAHTGIVALAVLPFRPRQRGLGALSLYDASARGWTEQELAIAGVFADLAATHVFTATVLDRQRTAIEQLQGALDSRIIIEQAKGMIAEQRGIGVDEAFVLLRKHANDHHAGLHATAEAVVHMGMRP